MWEGGGRGGGYSWARLVFLEQPLDALGQAGHGLILLRHHRRDVDAYLEGRGPARAARGASLEAPHGAGRGGV